MSLNDWRILFFSIGIILLAIILLTMTLSFFPLNEENFTSMAILGTNSKGVPLEGYYFPGDNFTIHLGKVMNWKIVLYNHRDSAQYVLVKVKILNSTMTAPNNVLGTPSSAPTIYETTKLLAKNSTLPIPFTWSFIYASITGNTARSILYKQISGSNVTITENEFSKLNGQKTSLVFELWSYDAKSNTFKFNTGSSDEPKIVWNQIWFKLTLK